MLYYNFFCVVSQRVQAPAIERDYKLSKRTHSSYPGQKVFIYAICGSSFHFKERYTEHHINSIAKRGKNDNYFFYYPLRITLVHVKQTFTYFHAKEKKVFKLDFEIHFIAKNKTKRKKWSAKKGGEEEDIHRSTDIIPFKCILSLPLRAKNVGKCDRRKPRQKYDF